MLYVDDEDHLQFDFENVMNEQYAQEPKTPRVTKKDTVCLYWIRGLCSRGDLDCEFIHRMDEEKMAMCQFGARCQNHTCPYRHYDLDIRPECVAFRRGFCAKGPMCPDRHIKRDPDKFWEYAITPTNEINPDHNKDNNPHHKTALCKTFMQTGRCSKGDRCGFAHGHHELRKRSRKLQTYSKQIRNTGHSM